MSGAIDFVVAARNAGRDATNDQARAAAAKLADKLTLPETEDGAVFHLAAAIKCALKALPHVAVGSRAFAGEALKKLAFALDTQARVFALAEASAPAHHTDPHTDEAPPARSIDAPGGSAAGRGAREIDPDEIPYRPGVDLKPPE